MKRRNYIIILVLLLVIGFAAVATNLIINGTLNLGFNDKNFDVYFSNVTLNGENKNAQFISGDGKTIDFETNELSIVKDQATIYYEVTNASREYDAEVKLVCDEFTNDYVSVTNVLNSKVIEAQQTVDGVLVAEMIKATTDAVDVKISCTITAIPTSRESIAESGENGEITTYSLYGYYVDESGNIVPNADLAIFSDTLHYVRTDNRGYFYVDGLEKGSHEIYYLKDIETIDDLTKEEIKSKSVSSSIFTTSSGSILFKDNSKVKDMVIELTKTRNYNITLKTSNGTIITEEYEVTYNKTYGNLPNVEVINASFLHWTLEDGTVITNETLVADAEEHTLIAVISPVVAPTIESSNTNWTDKDITISVSTLGVAEKGIKYYEYLITNKQNPSSEEEITGTTTDNITVSNTGTNYVYYRTVANDNVKSSWSNGVEVRIDKSAPTNVGFSNKVVDSTNVTMNVNYTENESSVTNTKCLYGDSSSQTNSGTLSNGTCVYPATAEYAKVCVVNSVGKETCSSPKQLATYFIKNGNLLVEFTNTENATISQGDGFYNLNFDTNFTNYGERGAMYTVNTYDFSSYNYTYVDLSYDLLVKEKCDPAFELVISSPPYYQGGVSSACYFNTMYCCVVKEVGYQENSPRKTYAKSFDGIVRTNDYLQISKNASSQDTNVKIYNVWLQLKD